MRVALDYSHFHGQNFTLNIYMMKFYTSNANFKQSNQISFEKIIRKLVSVYRCFLMILVNV